MVKLIHVYRRVKSLSSYNKVLQVISRSIKKRLLNRISYIVSINKIPQPIIFIAGFAKSGTTWFANMLTEIHGFANFTPIKWPLVGDGKKHMDLYDGVFKEFNNKLAIVKGHTWGSQGNALIIKNEYKGKYIIMVRDPRDALISAYWYIKKNPDHWDYPNVVNNSLSQFISYKLETQEFKTQFVDWLKSWTIFRDSDNSIILRYEDLLSNTYDELKRVLSFLQFNLDEKTIGEIVDKYDFNKQTGRKRGTENTNSVKRKAVAGEYKSVFNEEQQQIAFEQAADVLEYYGYEDN